MRAFALHRKHNHLSEKDAQFIHFPFIQTNQPIILHNGQRVAHQLARFDARELTDGLNTSTNFQVPKLAVEVQTCCGLRKRDSTLCAVCLCVHAHHPAR